MTKEEFKQMFIKMINFGWAQSALLNHLNEVANDDRQLAKVQNMADLVAYRNNISTHDALYGLIRKGYV